MLKTKLKKVEFLPNEIIIEILFFNTVGRLYNFFTVNKRFYDLCCCNILWKKLFQKSILSNYLNHRDIDKKLEKLGFGKDDKMYWKKLYFAFLFKLSFNEKPMNLTFKGFQCCSNEGNKVDVIRYSSDEIMVCYMGSDGDNLYILPLKPSDAAGGDLDFDDILPMNTSHTRKFFPRNDTSFERIMKMQSLGSSKNGKFVVLCENNKLHLVDETSSEEMMLGEEVKDFFFNDLSITKKKKLMVIMKETGKVGTYDIEEKKYEEIDLKFSLDSNQQQISFVLQSEISGSFYVGVDCKELYKISVDGTEKKKLLDNIHVKDLRERNGGNNIYVYVPHYEEWRNDQWTKLGSVPGEDDCYPLFNGDQLTIGVDYSKTRRFGMIVNTKMYEREFVSKNEEESPVEYVRELGDGRIVYLFVPYDCSEMFSKVFDWEIVEKEF